MEEVETLYVDLSKASFMFPVGSIVHLRPTDDQRAPRKWALVVSDGTRHIPVAYSKGFVSLARDSLVVPDEFI